MKYLNLTLIGMLFMQISPCQTVGGYRIKGKLERLDNGTTLYLVRKKENGKLDTVGKSVAQEGEFLMVGNVPLSAEFHYLQVAPSISRRSASILLESSDFDISGSILNWPENLTISGGEADASYRRLLSQIKEPRRDYMYHKQQLDSVRMLYGSNRAGKLSPSEPYNEPAIISKYERAMSNAIEKYNATMKAYVFGNLNSLYTPHLIMKCKNSMTLEEKKMAYERLSEEAKECFYGIQLKRDLDYSQISSQLRVGSKAPDFETLTMDGRVLNLMTEVANNKVTILDFWASWCIPCRKENRQLKELYQKYAGKGLGIISISTDHNEESWRKAVQEDLLVWPQIVSSSDKPYLSKMYAIAKLPSVFVVDRKGFIIGIDWQEKDMEARIGLLLD